MTGRRLIGQVPVFLGLLWLGAGAPASAQTLSFAPVVAYPTGERTTGTVLADVNNDGKLDLIVAACDNDLVRVRLGVGDGTFGSEQDFTVGAFTTPYGIAVADFNGDTYADIATANQFGDSVSILLGDGSGAFSAPTQFPAGAGPQGIVAVDFNGDTFIDLAVTNASDDTMTVLLGDGTGSFTDAGGSPFSTGAFPSGIRLGQFNSAVDNFIDIVITNTFDSSLTVFLGDGAGGFTPAPTVLMDLCGCPVPTDVAVLDLDGDTISDLVVTDPVEDFLWLFYGVGDGTFVDPPVTIPTVGMAPSSITTADFNNDGKTDVAVADTYSDMVEILLGDGAGNLTASGSFSTYTGAYYYSSPLWVAAGDLNGDGKIDIAVGQSDSEDTAVLLNDTCCFVTLTVAGSGTVTSVPATMNCTVDCVGLFDPLTAPELDATPDPGWLFTGWSLDCTGSGPCLLTAGADAHVTATFSHLTLDPGFSGGAVGASYGATATSSNGTGPFTFVLQTGSLPPGLVINDDGSIVGVPIAAGVYPFTLSATDANAVTGSGSYSITIAAGATSTGAADELVPYSDVAQIVSLVASVDNPAVVGGGTVTFTVRDAGTNVIGTPVVAAGISDGIAVADYVLPGGTLPQVLQITAAYSGDANFTSSSGLANLTIVAASTSTATTPATATFNTASQFVSLTASVTAIGSTVNGGTVTFTVRDSGAAVVGVPVVSGAVTGGSATASYTLPGGTGAQTLNVTAEYSGSTNFDASTSPGTGTLVVGAASSTTAAANATATYNATTQIVSLNATVTSPSGSVDAGTVTFTVRDAGANVIGVPVVSGTVTAGAASASYSLPGGTNAQTLTVTAVYSGTPNVTTSTDATHTLTIGAASSTTAAANATASFSTGAQNVPLTAAITSPAGVVNGGTVTFTVRTAGSVVVGAPATSGTVAGGVASATFTLPGGTGAQTLSITAVYNASTNFATSSDATHTLVIGPATTTTVMAGATVPTSPSPQAVPLQATLVSAGGTVGAGTVTFTVRTAGSVVVGSSVSGPVVGGFANATYTLPGGTAPQALTVTASYAATTNFGASQGTGTLNVAVCTALTVSPTAAALPAVRLGQPFSLTFTATGASDPVFALTGTPPPGLTMTGATLSGTPTELGRFDATVTAASAAISACAGNQPYTFRVMRPPVFVTGAGGVSPAVRVFDSQGTLTRSFLADTATFGGGIRVATADMNGDGIDDIITAPGHDAASSIVRVFDGATGTQINQMVAYPYSSPGGTYVAAGDVNGDGIPDIVTGRDGSPPEIKVFDGRTGAVVSDFFAYPLPAVGGVRVAVGDLDGDGIAEIITAPLPGGSPQVRIFNAAGTLRASFLAYDPAFIGGVFVAAGDIDGDGKADIVTGADGGGGPHVVAFSGVDFHILRSFFAYDPAFLGGVRVAVSDLDLDGHAEIITAAGAGGGPHVRVFDGVTGDEVLGLFAFDPAFTGGVFIAAASPQTRMAVAPPFNGTAVSSSFLVAGWATDGGATANSGSGVESIHVWAFPVGGVVPVFLGATTVDIPRPDVAALYGGFYSESGFGLNATLPPGTYDLVIFGHSAKSFTFNSVRIVRITVTP